MHRELKRIEATQEIQRIVLLFAQHKISILGGSYLHWELEQLYSPYDNSVYRHVYKSQVVAELWIVSGTVQSKRVRIIAGLVPPKASPADGPEVYVHGRPLPVSQPESKPEIVLDADDIPF